MLTRWFADVTLKNSLTVWHMVIDVIKAIDDMSHLLCDGACAHVRSQCFTWSANACIARLWDKVGQVGSEWLCAWCTTSVRVSECVRVSVGRHLIRLGTPGTNAASAHRHITNEAPQFTRKLRNARSSRSPGTSPTRNHTLPANSCDSPPRLSTHKILSHTEISRGQDSGSGI